MTREQAALALFVFLVGGFGVAGAAVTTEPGWIATAEYHDLQRLRDLNEIAAAVMQFKSRHATLPYDASKLTEAQPVDHPLQLTDPNSQQPYAYSRIDETTYQLCAVFALESTPVAMWAPITRSLPPVFNARANYPVVSGPASAPPPPVAVRFTTSSALFAGPMPRHLPPPFAATFQRVPVSPWRHAVGERCYKFSDRTTLPIEETDAGAAKG